MEEEEQEEEEQEENDESDEDEEPEEDEEVEVPEKFESIVDEISEMSVTDLAELVEVLEDKFGVSAQAPAAAPAAAPAGGGEGGGAEEEEKSSYDIELAEVGDSKIDVIKVVRDVTEKGLKDAKALVDDVPEVIMNDIDQEEAEEIKEQFEEAGASINLK